jgi:hypothetical protein
MTTNRNLSNPALVMMGLPVLLGAPLCYLRPGEVWAWVAGMFIVPVVWLGIKAARKVFGNAAIPTKHDRSPADTRKAVSGAVILASLLLSASLAAPLAAALGLIDESLARAIASRGVYVFVGWYFVLRGNRLPKMLTPLSDTRCDPARLQTLQRCTGWSYVLAGFALAVVWLLLPVHLAQPIGMAIIAVGVLLPTFILRSYATGRNALINH